MKGKNNSGKVHQCPWVITVLYYWKSSMSNESLKSIFRTDPACLEETQYSHRNSTSWDSSFYVIYLSWFRAEYSLLFERPMKDTESGQDKQNHYPVIFTEICGLWWWEWLNWWHSSVSQVTSELGQTLTLHPPELREKCFCKHQWKIRIIDVRLTLILAEVFLLTTVNRCKM